MTQSTTQPRSNLTRPLVNRIAIAFDFDETLAPDALNELLTYLDIDIAEFRDRQLQPLINQGWDKVAARCYCLIQASRQRPEDHRITYDTLAQLGRQMQPFPGVESMFERLRQHVQTINPDIDLEFYVITGGFGDIVRHTSIAPHFHEIWGCEFAYDDQGEIMFIKRGISHTEKTRYLMQIASGRETVDGNGRAFAYADVPKHELHVPLSQMVYVGDGASDVPCFSLINEEQGINIGVFKDGDQGHSPQGWGEQVQVSQSQRVSNLAAPNYQDDSEMMRSLRLAVECLCKRIELRQLSVGE